MVRNYKRKTEDRWTKEDLLEALTEIKERQLSVRDAAVKFKISRATLYRQLKKFLQSGGQWDVLQFNTCGGNPILTRMEEVVLETTVMQLKECGNIVTSSDIKRICFEYCDSNCIPNQFNEEKRMASDDWYYGFIKRHPLVRLEICDKSGEGSMELSDLDGNSQIPDRRKIPKKNTSGSKKSGDSLSSFVVGSSGPADPSMEIREGFPLQVPKLEKADLEESADNLQCVEVLGKRKSRGRPRKDGKGNKKTKKNGDGETEDPNFILLGQKLDVLDGTIDERGEETEPEDSDGVVEKKLFGEEETKKKTLEE